MSILFSSLDRHIRAKDVRHQKPLLLLTVELELRQHFVMMSDDGRCDISIEDVSNGKTISVRRRGDRSRTPESRMRQSGGDVLTTAGGESSASPPNINEHMQNPHTKTSCFRVSHNGCHI